MHIRYYRKESILCFLWQLFISSVSQSADVLLVTEVHLKDYYSYDVIIGYYT